ncbi:cupin domain-containing protein [Kitasatospora cathayae]|uniref:Cupin domain-containing protein n=1 Tax=Kitasatospora cathayae TaxID=3004092 RepID=A0ABY7PWB7_9ACTN|nr:cupin domain-containing protein [Kitasatospora sp. HUAS 3-15]WBP84661.1 cupin domain-containing protein [Kitasatospora sp. HUAS 3-15]
MKNDNTSGATSVEQSPISRVVLMDTALLKAKATSRVEARRISLAPGFAAGYHVHNGPVFGSILEGSVILQVEGEPESLLEPGDPFYEPEGVPVRFDATDDGATFLAFFLLEVGQEPKISMLAG